jgi:phosphoenolpyruvate carboxykinase (ATP)
MNPNLEFFGIKPASIFYNLDYSQIYEKEKLNPNIIETASGAIAIDTGKFTGRSPKDKFFVDEASSKNNIWWGNVNAPIKEDVFDAIFAKAIKQFNKKDIYISDGFCGANSNSQMKIRVITEHVWQAHFCKNMFIRPSKNEINHFMPDFTVLNASDFSDENWKEHGLNSPVFILFHLAKKLAIIGGTSYTGEMKKGVFSVMNYFLPLKKVLSMHCSANQDSKGNTALFFGLSGTGKTTLSADPKRFLIGDDEHGWDDEGIFNLEGGCYAKTINLSAKNEPEIYKAIRKNALLENVVVNPNTKEVDYNDISKTENTRVSYPIEHIDKIVRPLSKGSHPKKVIFLTCDAFGVLPAVSKLNKGQAMYYYLSGYTAKVAGTERGVKEPSATFSPCFGGPFLTLHPTVYAKLLGEKLEKHNADVYLVNTGWVGGGYGIGTRMNLPDTRLIIQSILDGSIENSPTELEPIFNLQVPNQIAGVDRKNLIPWEAWRSKSDYEATCNKVAKMFIQNFEQYKNGNSTEDYSVYGPKAKI